MMTLVQDTLALWRDAEATLEQLPPTAPDHATVERLVVELRTAYARLTAAREWSDAELERSRESIRDAQRLLASIDGARRPSDGDSGPGASRSVVT